MGTCNLFVEPNPGTPLTGVENVVGHRRGTGGAQGGGCIGPVASGGVVAQTLSLKRVCGCIGPFAAWGAVA